ncbi:MAG TPA: 2-phospho-L-lactate transferase [Stellaceae bacterium]|jgi:LPPG:FO 2-phospho-L-lactate transferase|nr:2-phospho-L-lactate transferase [Stellaceae bacterium]
MSVLALSGGIGGAKLALGLYRVLPPGELTVVANTGDDFEHLGLSISPDIDTLLYTLAGIDNPELGWGRRSETWTFMAALEALGGETWFKLGDGDLATHVERTRLLAAGESLSQITDDFRRRLGISARLLPMSDDRVRTRLQAQEGWLDFQDYFVRLRASPVVREIAYAGASEARANPDFLAALAGDDVELVVICPSNPFLSIDPIISLPRVRDALRACRAPVVAVSPIIGGKAVKGPTAKIMAELGLPVGAAAVARHYEDVIDNFIVEETDANEVEDLGIPVRLARTLMSTIEDREALARVVLAVAGRGV